MKWVGYDSSQNTWEPEKNLSTVKNLITKYNASINKNGTNKSTNNGKKPIEETKNMGSEDDDENERFSMKSLGNDSAPESKV